MGRLLEGSAFGSEGGEGGVFESPAISLIIDDFGWSYRWAEIFLAIGLPFSFSVLPRLAYSSRVADVVSQSGRQVMLHQPMEPFGSKCDPGPGAIYVKDNPERIKRVVSENIESLKFAEGVNNHMGSRFTSDAGRMDSALGTVKECGLFFVDSVTSERSVGFSRARTLLIPATRRNLFIDNVKDRKHIRNQLALLYRRGLRNGRAVGIGHARKETALAVEEFARDYPDFANCLVPVSRLTVRES